MTDIIIFYLLQSVACGISSISVWALIIAILRNPKLRSNTFDLYLVFSFAADAIYFTLMLVINMTFLVELYSGGEFSTPGVIMFLYWVLTEYYWPCASLWMSFAIFMQIYKLLVSNKQTKRYQPPTKRRVIRDSTMIHVFSAVLGIAITSLNKTLWASWHDNNHITYLWLSCIPGVFIPTLLITGMCFGVWWNQLMPPKDNRYRSLTMFFARLLASIFLMVVGMILINALDTWNWIKQEDEGNFHLDGFSFCWIIFSLFGFFQVCLALTKNELRNAFVELWCCCRRRQNSNKGVMPSTGTSTTLTNHPTQDESHGQEDNDDDTELGNVASHSRADDATSSMKIESEKNNELASEQTETIISDTEMTNEMTVPDLHSSQS